MNNQFSVVFPSRDIQSVISCVESLLNNSTSVNEIVIVWNGIETFPNGLITQWSANNPNVDIINIQMSSGVYSMFNEGVRRATNNLVLLCNDDMYFSPEWDEYIDDALLTLSEAEFPVITFSLVEPGFVGVNEKNIKLDFGQTIETFKEKEFDKYASENKTEDGYNFQGGLGWFMPALFDRQFFLNLGGYPVEPEFPYPQDVVFFNHLEKLPNVKFIKMAQKVYHFQRLSQRPNDNPTSYNLNLCCGDDIRDGFLNVDKKDFDVSLANFPYENERFRHVLFHHALEHFRLEIGKNILKEIFRVLKPQGILDVAVPDMILAFEDYLVGFNAYPNCAPPIQRIYGLSTSEEQVHKCGFTTESLTELLKEVGFSTIYNNTTEIMDEISIRAIK